MIHAFYKTILLTLTLTFIISSVSLNAGIINWIKNNQKKSLLIAYGTLHIKNTWECKDHAFWELKTFYDSTKNYTSCIKWKNVGKAILAIVNSNYNNALLTVFWKPATTIQESQKYKNLQLQYQNSRESCRNSVDLLKHLGLDGSTKQYKALCNALINCKDKDGLKIFLKKTELKADSNSNFDTYKENAWKALKNIANSAGKIKAAYDGLDPKTKN